MCSPCPPRSGRYAASLPDRRAFLALTGSALVAGAAAPPARTRLVTGHPEAAAAGNDVLAAGGNAVDAAVTAAVVAVPGCGVGGYGGHLVVATPTGEVTAIDFNSAAPAALKPDAYEVTAHGWLSVGVPGTLAGLQLALDRHGTRGLGAAAGPAIRHARDGFRVSKRFAAALAANAKRLGGDPGSAKLFFDGGKPLAAGALYRNPDLAALLESLAKRDSVEAFYRGDHARTIAAAFAAGGGLVTEKDLAAYRARVVKPLSLEWRGHVIHTAAPTAGGLTVLQALATLKALGWEKWGRDAPGRTQARVDALRIAWDDRLRLLGDPDHAAVPVERLLSPRHAGLSADRVRAAIAARRPVEAAGDGRRAGGTVHLTAIDSAGLTVALTLTHGDSFGAKVTVPGLGVLLGHGLSRFDPRRGRPNSPAPGKRPLHNMCPTVVSRGGRPVLALGAAGGRRIPNAVFDVLLGRIGEGRPLAEAVAAPRLHTEGGRDLSVEAGWPEAEVKELVATGYAVKALPGAVLNAIERDPETGAVRDAAR